MFVYIYIYILVVVVEECEGALEESALLGTQNCK